MPGLPKQLIPISGHLMWAGTLESRDAFIAAFDHWSKLTPMSAGIVATNGVIGGSKEDEKPMSRLLTVANGVGILSIKGTLVSEDSWWNSYAGLVSYPEIRQAAHEAKIHPDVKEVILDVASPGGHVAGIFDAADALRDLARSKRVTGYTDSTAASGGYWLLATASKRYAAPIASLGSIGVVLPHMEYSKYLSDEGINATVFRAGKYKALGHPIEALTKLAEDEINARLDHVYGVFTETMAEYLGTTQAVVISRMAEGRVFVGSQAVDAGLIDGVSSFDNVYATVVKRVANQGDSPMKKKFNGAQLLAAAAAGAISAEELVKAQALLASSADGTVELDVADPTDGSENGAEPPAAQEPAAPAEPAAQEPAAAAPAEPVAQTGNSAEALLKEQLSEANERIVALRVELDAANKMAASLETVVKPLASIAAQSVNNMLVALGQPPAAELAAASPVDIVARHEAVSVSFVAAFPIGGVSAAPQDEPAEPQANSQSFVEQRALAAQRKGLTVVK